MCSVAALYVLAWVRGIRAVYPIGFYCPLGGGVALLLAKRSQACTRFELGGGTLAFSLPSMPSPRPEDTLRVPQRFFEVSSHLRCRIFVAYVCSWFTLQQQYRWNSQGHMHAVVKKKALPFSFVPVLTDVFFTGLARKRAVDTRHANESTHTRVCACGVAY